MSDFLVIDHGTIVTFKPLTGKAREWWDEHTNAEEFCAQQHCAEARYAGDIIHGILSDGLTIN